MLSIALSTLAGWFGLRLTHFGWQLESLRVPALAYAALVAAAGTALHRARVKAHFLETYLHVAANTALVVLMTGVFDRQESVLYSLGLGAVAAAAIVLGLRFRSFAFVLYGIAYSYIGFSSLLQQHARMSFEFVMLYDFVSASAVVILLVVLARRFGRES